MILMSIVAIVLALFALFEGRLLHFAIIYLVAGLFWIFKDKRLPVYNRPLYVSNRISRYLMVLIWPLRFVAVCREYFYFRNHPERFLVTGYGSFDSPEHSEYKTFDEALRFSREKAKTLKDPESYLEDSESIEFEKISDDELKNLIFSYGSISILDRALNRQYEVNPAGFVKKTK